MTDADRRLVVIGDLNGAADALRGILHGTGLTDQNGRWTGGATELVQMGDVVNRGGGARRAIELLVRLRREARAVGGDVTVLLGNHEVMIALGNESYCTEAEYLSFATARERATWPARVRRATLRLARQHPPGGPIAPIAPRVEAWKLDHVPGRAALRRSVSPDGRIGRWIRALPVVIRRGDTVLVHAGLTRDWAAPGLDALAARARAEWGRRPGFIRDLPRRALLRAADGPLCDRSLARGVGPDAERHLAEVLALVGARRLVVGHSETRTLPGGAPGRVLSRFGGRLLCVDVGLSEATAHRAALVLAGGCAWQWTPAGVDRLDPPEQPASAPDAGPGPAPGPGP